MKKPLEIKFISSSVTDSYRFKPPVPASEMLPSWYANQTSYTEGKKVIQKNGTYNGTIKKCMPVFDVMSSGYIISTICELNVSDKGILKEFSWPLNDFKAIEFHDRAQFDAIPFDENIWHTKTAFKFINPWTIKTPKGYSTLFTMPFYHYDLPFFCLSAVVDTDRHPVPVNFPFLVKKDFVGIIPENTPIIQAIPFKRDDWKSSILMDDSGTGLAEFSKGERKFGNRYKTFWREIKTYN